LFSGELSFQEYEKRVREVNTDYSNVSVGKVLDTREAAGIVDIDKLIDIDDLSGLSSSTSENSEESQPDNESSKKQKNDTEPKSKRRRRNKKQQDSDEDTDSEEESEVKIVDPNEIRNKMVEHLEQMRLAKQKMKRSKEILHSFYIKFFSLQNVQINPNVPQLENVLYQQ
jgi:hypothetical protein